MKRESPVAVDPPAVGVAGAGPGAAQDAGRAAEQGAGRREGPDDGPGDGPAPGPRDGRRPRIVVGISGASGVVYGLTTLRLLRGLGLESHVVMSRAAQVALGHETDLSVADVRALADFWYRHDDIGAAIASGSFRTAGMIVAPCSIKTLSEIATGVTGGLLSRAADVTLKERRRLVLMVRETPLHAGHLKSMLAATEAGAIIAPPVPAFYAKPPSLEAMVEHSVGRVLDLFELDAGVVRRWG